MLKRPINFITSRLLDLKYRSQVNEHNIESLNRFKLWRIFKHEHIDIKQIYLCNIIDRWTQNQEQLSIKFLYRLKKLIRKTKLQLNNLETHQLNLVEERIFSSLRHIKVLNINFKLYTKELAFAKFTNSQTYKIKNNHMLLVLEGDLFMTNRRFIIYNQTSQKTISLYYRSWTNYHLTNYGIVLINGKNQQLILRIHDQITLNQTFINLIQKRVKWLAKKLNLKNRIIFKKQKEQNVHKQY